MLNSLCLSLISEQVIKGFTWECGMTLVIMRPIWLGSMATFDSPPIFYLYFQRVGYKTSFPKKVLDHNIVCPHPSVLLPKFWQGLGVLYCLIVLNATKRHSSFRSLLCLLPSSSSCWKVSFPQLLLFLRSGSLPPAFSSGFERCAHSFALCV